MFCKGNFTNIKSLLTGKYVFYAHTARDKKELLESHTELCEKYFLLIDREKKLYRVFEKICDVFLKDMGNKSVKLYFDMIATVISFHDIGKINPNFQEAKMNNKLKFDIKPNFNKISSEHSIVSSVLYINYFFDKIRTFDKNEQNILFIFLFLNAYAISRHHGNMGNFSDFLEQFYEESDGKASSVIEIFEKSYKDALNCEFTLTNKKARVVAEFIRNNFFNKISSDRSISIYTYERLIYSVLTSCDYYATTEFINGTGTSYFGDIKQINDFYDVYKNSKIYKSIRDYEKNRYGTSENLSKCDDINVLRDEMFIDSEREMVKNINKDLFFLEAPTGSGKSNTAMNLSFKLIERDNTLSKIIYVYPFNTLVEQNLNNIKKIFMNDSNILNKITVINSVFPIKMDKSMIKDNSDDYYQKALLDRQFLNYPFILTTHVSLFDTMFNSRRESIFSFHQLINSVVVLDEIQSYKNIIWTEIISFLKKYAEILNMKVIIMSATLPDLNILIGKSSDTVKLIKNHGKYYKNPLFRDRVSINYTLLNKEFSINSLYEHVKQSSQSNKNILIEFIKKKSAYEFYNKLCEDNEIESVIELMTGDDNSIERSRIIEKINDGEVKRKGMILVATQVIEAGIDIDMDIGYKDISKLDSEEQFMGRINRSCLRQGIVYFFNYDNTKSIYKNDIRVNKQFSLLEEDIRTILVDKKFNNYYIEIMKGIKENYNDTLNGDINIEEFFKKVGKPDFLEVEKRMKLIEDNDYNMSVFLASTITTKEGSILDGVIIWEEYEKLLMSNNMDFAEKFIELSKIRSYMNYFIYQIKKNDNLCYNDKIGSLYFIEEGDQYFKNGKLDKDKFITGVGEFF